MFVNCAWSTFNVPFNTAADIPIVSYLAGVLHSSNAFAWQWNFNGSIVPGATSDTLTPQQNGNYSVTAYNGFGCSATSAVYSVTDVGVNEIASVASVSIFPNPNAGNELHLFSENDILNADLILADAIGRLIKRREKISLLKGNNSLEIDQRNLSAGVYWIELQKDNQLLYRGRLIVE